MTHLETVSGPFSVDFADHLADQVRSAPACPGSTDPLLVLGKPTRMPGKELPLRLAYQNPIGLPLTAGMPK